MSVESRRKRTITILTIVFAVVFYALIFNGGACDRYKDHMRSQDAKKKWLQEQREKGREQRGVDR